MDSTGFDQKSDAKAIWLVRMYDESQNRYLIFGPFDQSRLCHVLMTDEALVHFRRRIDSKTEICNSLGFWISLSDEQDMIQFFERDFVVQLRKRVSIADDGEPTIAIHDLSLSQSGAGDQNGDADRSEVDGANQNIALKTLHSTFPESNNISTPKGVESTGLLRGLAWLLVFGLLIMAYVALRFSRELGLNFK